MSQLYKNFLEGKGTNSFWKKAKQLEFTQPKATEKIFEYLTKRRRELTTRNSMTLRYLGLIINKGGDRLDISEAGKTFVESPYKQKILDEQLMKVYLCCTEVNNRICIKIIPLKVLLYITKELNHFTFDEYQLFICWTNTYEEIKTAIKLIQKYRSAKDKEIYRNILKEQSKTLNISDFADNIKRFFDMLMISSYFDYNKDKGVILPRITKKDIEIIIQSFDDSNYDEKKYYQFLVNNDGWKMYSAKPDYIKIIDLLEKQNEVSRKKIIAGIVEETKMEIPVKNTLPKTINLKLGEKIKVVKLKKIGKKKSPVKINFEERDATNRKYGNRAEEIVVKYEKDLLRKLPELAKLVDQASLSDDSLGYDVLSYDISKRKKHIEVKAVKNKPSGSFRFFISENEIKIAQRDKYYFLYIVFDYLSEVPLIYIMPNPFVKKIPGVTITPVKHEVMVEINKL